MSTQYSPRIVTTGLVAYLDAANTKSYAGSGTTWNDLSNNSNTATLVNGAVYSAGYNGYIRCDGSDDYIEIATNNGMVFGTGGFTIEYWFRKLSTTTGYDNIWGPNKWNSGGSPGTNEWTMTIGAGSSGTGDTYEFVVESGSTAYAVQSSTALSLNTWYQLVAVRDGNTLKLYLNGSLVISTTPSGFTSSTAINDISARKLRIGNSGLNNFYTNVDTSMLRVYNQALTATQILQNYNAQRGRFVEPVEIPVVTDSLVLHLDAGNTASYSGSGTTWYDLTSNHFDSTLTNGAGYSSGAITFDATDDYVAVSSAMSSVIVTDTPGYSISGWFYINNNDFANWRTIIAKQGDNRQYYVGLNGGYGPPYRGLSFFSNQSGQGGVGTDPLVAGRWYYFCATHYGTSGTGNTLYVRSLAGIESITTFASTGTSEIGTDIGINPIKIGKYTDGVPFLWDGKIAIVCVYGKKLSEAEILQNFNSAKGRFGL